MPLDNAGAYHMNPAHAAMANAHAEPDGDETAGASKQIVLTENPDGTWSCDDGSGEPSTHGSLDETLNYVKEQHGDQGEESQEGETTGAGSDVDDQY